MSKAPSDIRFPLRLCICLVITEQLRVHCAEVLGTPIVGDYKYGRQAHRKLEQYLKSASDPKLGAMPSKVDQDSSCLDLESGSISDEQYSLHLHCKEMILPDISVVLQHGNVDDLDTARIGNVMLNAPLPPHMQRSWDLLNSSLQYPNSRF